MTFTIRRSILVVLVSLVVVSAGVFVAQHASAASATPVVYVATGENFPDALGAGPAAAMVNGPILLVAHDAIPGQTATELTRLSPDKIIIVGGTAVVSPNVENGLKAYAATVERIAGTNRYDTAAKLSAATFPVAGGTDSFEVKIRYADGDFFVDMTDPATDRMRCITAPVTFGTATTVVAAGGLSLQPWGAINAYEIWGDVYYSTDSGASWAIFDNLSLEDTPPNGIGNAAIALNSAKTLDTGTYIFGIQPFGNDAGEGDDYTGYCQLTVTAYTGQGPDTDFVATLTD